MLEIGERPIFWKLSEIDGKWKNDYIWVYNVPVVQGARGVQCEQARNHILKYRGLGERVEVVVGEGELI